ncbi:hypothetical protein Golomagni_02725 [Golovinomyces magnicellulatus]|nr:hypothetical protein Golomagni_02725 [Golovinomyces magnicellulatus]
MDVTNLNKSYRLMLVTAIYFSFFIAEVSVGFYSHSLALVADAFHCVTNSWNNLDLTFKKLNDLLGFVVALVALSRLLPIKMKPTAETMEVSKKNKITEEMSFGWHRAQILGAFFNGVFLLALSVSTFLQSIERFISLQRIENPMLVLIMGCIGLIMNIISIFLLHENHKLVTKIFIKIDHSHGHQIPSQVPNNVGNQKASGSQQDHDHAQNHRDFGMMGIIAHLISDALNNIGIIVAALVIWKGQFPSRFYSDPIVSLCIAIMILITSLPLCKNAGLILMESVPSGIRLEDIKNDLEKIPDIIAIRDLHVWRLSQEICLASAKVLTKENSLESFVNSVWQINECLHTYGIQSATIQPILLYDVPKIILKSNTKFSLKER